MQLKDHYAEDDGEIRTSGGSHDTSYSYHAGGFVQGARELEITNGWICWWAWPVYNLQKLRNMNHNGVGSDVAFYTEKLAISTEHCVPAPSASRIEVQQDTKMELALIDTSTGEMVSYGPISSEKVEILVIVGDFDDDMGNKWKHEKFNSNFVRVRKRKKALIMGDVVLNLRDGVGLLGDIYYYR
ncbi:hypothetical protein POM88_044031 [Heracleum sosnowskyi]|uniref:Calmodulin binding protein-like N-terminal domain-containing protein n=1 Tax=Heracleum sosnowskyi TaxID=360622 RepID=A0AAD8H223_9APIA|nr:hypothetical protein POM88_044031 [Heracleum sosnowskyi]